MFWKGVKFFNKTATISPKSITGKLTLLYMASSFLLLSVALAAIYFAMVNMIRHHDYTFVKGELETLQKILSSTDQQNIITGLHQEVVLEPKTNPNHYLARVMGKNNSLLIETPGVNQLFKQSEFPIPPDKDSIPSSGKYLAFSKDRHYLIMSMRIQQHNNTYIAQVALNVTRSEQIINLYQEVLSIALVIMFLVSLGLSIFITRRGLKPIYALNKGIDGIDINNLNLDLNLKKWPKELRDTVNILNQMLQGVNKSFTRLSRFSEDLAHELRTPLNNMICQIQITLSKNRTLTEYQSILASTLEEAQNMATLLNKMLFIARAKTPAQELQRQVINFAQEMKNLCEYYGVLAKDKEIEIVINGGGQIYVDFSLFKQAIGNLLSNAIKYTPKSGIITCSISENKNESIICISDTGIGISSKKLPHVFDRFYRTDESRSKNIEGVGLGLAIVKSIIELHHGIIRIESDLGKGTNVYLHLPKS
ncbi:heavy metal sensor histidine kinase [Cysteiniphilum halobium]|uniref:heavy metal sensor histidine kinase n=1 Tax=Cysteiniphilum halobium TaxID=2219059 RepID=UPI003F86005F